MHLHSTLCCLEFDLLTKLALIRAKSHCFRHFSCGLNSGSRLVTISEHDPSITNCNKSRILGNSHPFVVFAAA